MLNQAILRTSGSIATCIMEVTRIISNHVLYDKDFKIGFRIVKLQNLYKKLKIVKTNTFLNLKDIEFL